ncbi:MAG: pilus assembly protein PilP [Candidatus Manganitrophaceae bacterium]
MFGFLAVGCGEGVPQEAAKGTPMQAASVVPKPPVPSVQEAVSPVVPAEKIESVEKKEEPVNLFQYNPEGRREPFRSIIVASGKRVSLENLPPLQRKDLSELKLIGIVWGQFGHGAVVQTPDGKGYPVRRGTRIGTNNGVVSQITNKEMVVEEKYLDVFGATKIRTVVIDLHPPKEALE